MTKPSEPTEATKEIDENWWDVCPICGSTLLNQKCRFVCPNPQCRFFMSCSEFDV
ncbi:MAG TPA: hypothetical protein VIB79_25990 [Candidatus Binatia bacterium]|jgi:hypothetical protein